MATHPVPLPGWDLGLKREAATHPGLSTGAILASSARAAPPCSPRGACPLCCSACGPKQHLGTPRPLVLSCDGVSQGGLEDRPSPPRSWDHPKGVLGKKEERTRGQPHQGPGGQGAWDLVHRMCPGAGPLLLCPARALWALRALLQLSAGELPGAGKEEGSALLCAHAPQLGGSTQ